MLLLSPVIEKVGPVHLDLYFVPVDTVTGYDISVVVLSTANMQAALESEVHKHLRFDKRGLLSPANLHFLGPPVSHVPIPSGARVPPNFHPGHS